jgi:lysophospholipase
MRTFALILTLLCLKIAQAHAISELNYHEEYKEVTKLLADCEAPQPKICRTFRFEGERDVLLAAIRFVHPESAPATRGTIVVLPGRSEPYLKYAEVFYDLYSQGFDVYSYDHRGQGLSPHLSSHRAQIGHIDDFLNYVEDLRRFTDQQVKPRARGPLFLLAHSMGGGIAARYLIEYPGNYARAVLSAPMIDLQTTPYPRPIARLIVASAVRIGLGNRYAPGYGDLKLDIPIGQNRVTHSVLRAQTWDAITRARPEIAIGGPSNKWVQESLDESRVTQAWMSDLTTPVLMLQAGEDTLVVNSAMNRGCKRARDCRIESQDFLTSRHEILMEVDAIRKPAMDKILDFLGVGATFL